MLLTRLDQPQAALLFDENKIRKSRDDNLSAARREKMFSLFITVQHLQVYSKIQFCLERNHQRRERREVEIC